MRFRRRPQASSDRAAAHRLWRYRRRPA